MVAGEVVPPVAAAAGWGALAAAGAAAARSRRRPWRRSGWRRPTGGAPGAGAPGAGASDTVRAVLGTLADIQESFRDRAREQLTAVQRTCADSLQQVMLAEERAKSEKERDKRQPRR